MAVRIQRLWPVALAAVAGTIALAGGLAVGESPAMDWQLAARWTARAALPFLLITFIASSLATLWPGEATRGLLRDRRWWGLAFALAHTIHLFALVQVLRLMDEPASALSLIGGGAGYFLLYAMMLTSSRTAMRILGRWWKGLHTTGIWYLWFVFTFSYLGRMLDPGRVVIAAPLLAMCIGALAIRLAAWGKRRGSAFHPVAAVDPQ